MYIYWADQFCGFDFFQIPKSTRDSSARTIQRKNIFSRLQVDPRLGLGICLRVRSGALGKEKK